MIVAVTYDKETGSIFQHFGHTEFFKVYKTDETGIIDTKIVSTNGAGHGALATFLKDMSVNIVVCGGIGGGAKDALKNAGIKLYGGVTGDPDVAVAALTKNSLKYDPNVKCTSHEHEHSCGEHSCASHTCTEHSCQNH